MISVSVSAEGDPVAQLVVRGLEAWVKARLRARAKRNGRGMEDEVRQILRAAAREPAPKATKLGTAIAARFREYRLDADIPELRGWRVLEFDSAAAEAAADLAAQRAPDRTGR